MRTVRNVIAALFVTVAMATSDSVTQAYSSCWNWCAEPFIWARSCYWDYEEYAPGERYCWQYGPGNVAYIAQEWCQQWAEPWDPFPNASVDFCDEQGEQTEAQISCFWYNYGTECTP